MVPKSTRSRRAARARETPGDPGARREDIGNIRPTSNAEGRDGSRIECRETSPRAAGHADASVGVERGGRHRPAGRAEGSAEGMPAPLQGVYACAEKGLLTRALPLGVVGDAQLVEDVLRRAVPDGRDVALVAEVL